MVSGDRLPDEKEGIHARTEDARGPRRPPRPDARWRLRRNPVSGRPEVTLVSEAKERELGEAEARRVAETMGILEYAGGQ